MNSKNFVKTIYLSKDNHEGVLFEGVLGKLERIEIIDDVLLEIKGNNGILRIDLSKVELMNILSK